MLRVWSCLRQQRYGQYWHRAGALRGRDSAIQAHEPGKPQATERRLPAKAVPGALAEYVTIQRHTAQHPRSCSDESLHEHGR